MEKGCDALQKALDMAREDHLIMPFAEYAPEILDMLHHIAANDTYVKEVLGACEQYMEHLNHVRPCVVSLTQRELEILALTAEGLKRSEIAAKLYVSGGTVKTHFEHIYRKLAVKGKTEAIRKVQKLKLF